MTAVIFQWRSRKGVHGFQEGARGELGRASSNQAVEGTLVSCHLGAEVEGGSGRDETQVKAGQAGCWSHDQGWPTMEASVGGSPVPSVMQ